MHVHGRRDVPMAAIAEAIQPQAVAEQQSQAGAASSDTDKAEDDANTNVAADTVEDSTATSTGTSDVNTETADGTPPRPAPPPHPLAPRPTPLPRPSPPRYKPATPTPPRQPKTASPSPSRGTTPRGHRDDLPRNPDQRLVPGQGAHGRAHILGRRRPGKRLRPVARGMGQLLQPSGPRSRSRPKNPRGTTIHLHGASEGAYPKSEMVKPAAARCRGARPAGWHARVDALANFLGTQEMSSFTRFYTDA